MEKKDVSCVSFAVYSQALNSGPMFHRLLLHVLQMPHFSFDTAPVTWCTPPLDSSCVSVVKSRGNRLAQTFVNCKSLLKTASTEPRLIPSLSAVVSAVIRLSARISSSTFSAFPSVDALRVLPGHLSPTVLVLQFLNNCTHSYTFLRARQLSPY